MDRSWMKKPRITKDYENRVEYFLQFAELNARSLGGKFFCPCVKCANGRRQSLNEIRTHLICEGIIQSYTKWIWHGESSDLPSMSEIVSHDDVFGCRLEEMIRDIGQEGIREAHAPYYDQLQSDSNKPLYAGCTTFTRMSAVLGLVNLKTRFGWSDKSLTTLLQLLKNMLPEDNVLLKNHYDAKKILCPVGLEYQKIHACSNDYMLYRGDFATLRNCPVCGVSWYKVKDDDSGNDATPKNQCPAKVCWYLPIIPRFKRLFSNENDAKHFTWHAEGRRVDGFLRHPADSPQWKMIDCLYPEFGLDPRNLRLVLASNGMNPFGSLNTNHSSWPVLLMIYNLPLWLCMKRKYILLAMMISGPRQPGNDIDVYLSPLIKDLQKLWVDDVEVFDANAKQSFLLRGMVFCTINDFLAYGNLGGYSVKGHYACPICEKQTSYLQLKHGKKIVYTRHRRFLKPYHPYRRLKKAFNG